jgi:hypothetical protein
MTSHEHSHPAAKKAPRLARLGIGIACLTIVWVLPDVAAAKPAFGIDVDSSHLSDGDRTDTGWGAGLRFGDEWKPLILTLNPELSAQFGRLSGTDTVTTYRAMGGARLGIGFIIQPSVFAHAGVGYLDQPMYGSGFGFAYDGGGALDLTLLPHFDFGVHANIAGITAPGSADRGAGWWVLGLHVQFTGS